MNRAVSGFGRWGGPLLAAMVLAACAGQGSLTQAEVESRMQEYFQRGMEQYQRGEFKRALESFRLAKAYDAQSTNASISEMIEKAEARLKPGAIAGSAGAGRSAVVPTTVVPPAESRMRTYRSRLYPYSIDAPENWSFEPAGTMFANAPADLYEASSEGTIPTRLTVTAHELPTDIDRRGYLETHRKLLRLAGFDIQEIGKRNVDGAETFLLRGRLNTDQGKLTATFAVFASETVGWSIALTAGTEQSERLQPLFHQMLDSFRVTGQTSV